MGEPFTLDPREVRSIARRMGIPEGQELPPIQVEEVETPELYRSSLPKSENPSGYVILLPEKELAKVTEDEYTLGGEAIDDIRHELAHYIRRKADPSIPLSKDMSLEELVAWELEAEISSGVKGSLSLGIAGLVRNVAQERGLSEEEVTRAVRRVGPRMGISKHMITRAERLL